MSIYFLRHGQAFHNTKECKELPEMPRVSPLTELGQEQAKNSKVPEEIHEVWTSPTRRTVETALLAGLAKENRPMHMKHYLSEMDLRCTFLSNGCDDETYALYGHHYTTIDDPVPVLNIPDHKTEVKTRIDTIRKDLKKWSDENPGKVLVVVGHYFLFNLVSGTSLSLATGECKQYMME